MKRSNSSPLISLVVPVLNEEVSIPILYKAVRQQIVKYEYEIIFVNDGSTDKSASLVEELCKKDKQVKLINLSRNFGHQMAITCGLDFANGDAVIIMDADLQDPPRLIPEMLAKWRLGYDVVYGVRRERRGENRFKLLTANLFYQLINLLSPTKIPLNAGDFRLISGKVLITLKNTREYQRFVRGLVSWVGFRQIGIEYEREQRYAGYSKYNSQAMLKLGLDALFSFSLFPLRIASMLGLITAIGAAVYVIYALVVTFRGNTIRGWSSTVVLMLFLGSIQLISLGIIGEYLGRIYEETKKRPLYIIDSVIGFPISKTQTSRTN